MTALGGCDVCYSGAKMYGTPYMTTSTQPRVLSLLFATTEAIVHVGVPALDVDSCWFGNILVIKHLSSITDT